MCIFFHGFVFEEDEKLVLLDYKTDGQITEEQLKKRYWRQFELYRIALEQITGKEVSEMYLWSFSLEKAVDMKYCLQESGTEGSD